MVKVSGSRFAKTGYVEWRPGLTLLEVEVAAGYKMGDGYYPMVTVIRGREKIYEASFPLSYLRKFRVPTTIHKPEDHSQT